MIGKAQPSATTVRPTMDTVIFDRYFGVLFNQILKLDTSPGKAKTDTGWPDRVIGTQKQGLLVGQRTQQIDTPLIMRFFHQHANGSFQDAAIRKTCNIDNKNKVMEIISWLGLLPLNLA